jgi:hypothetical protein
MFGQDRQSAGMVDMGVRQQYSSNGFGIEAETTILVLCLLAAPLKHPAVHQHVTSWYCDKMAASSDRPCSAVK